MVTARELITRLKNVQGNGDSWTALCPAHNDQRRSLSIGVGRNGAPLLRCHAGCDFAKITRALGLTLADFQVQKSVPTYDYTDENGSLLYQVIRREGKEFRSRVPDGHGGWTWSTKGVRRVLYRLPDVVRAIAAGKPVCVVEGEKDADNVARCGLAATTNSHGAGKWGKAHADSLRGARVVIIPDNDAPGIAHAKLVAASLRGIAAECRVLLLEGLPVKGDVSDWLASGHDGGELARLLTTAPLAERVEWPRFEEAPSQHAERPKALGDNAPGKQATVTKAPAVIKPVVLHSITLSDVTPEAVRWLWPGYLPLGKLTVLEGDPGLSKSTVTLDWAARLSSGNPWPDGSRHTAADVIVLTMEDGLADTVRPRAEAAGADLTRIHVLRGVEKNGGPEQLVTLPDDLPMIAERLRTTGARLFVVDPLNAALSGAVDAYKDHDIRRALAPLAQLAEQTGAAVVVVRHLTKGNRGSAVMAGAGSVGISGQARVVLAVHRHPEDDGTGDRRILAVAKCNVARLAPSLTYRLESVGTVARVQWEGVSNLSADDLTASRSDDGERSAVDDAKGFLLAALKSGPRPKADLLKESRPEGVASRTLERAATALGVISARGFGTGAVWRLPDEFRPSSPTSPRFGENGETVPSSPKTPIFANSAYIGERGELGKVGEDGGSADSSGASGNGVIRAADGFESFTPERIADELHRRREQRAEREA